MHCNSPEYSPSAIPLSDAAKLVVAYVLSLESIAQFVRN